MYRLAIIASHPIQYFAPWFQDIAKHRAVDLRVFYLWNFGATKQYDRTFQRDICWDLPLLDGYESTFCRNTAREPGTHSFHGLRNPDLMRDVLAFSPDAVLVFGYAWRSQLSFIWRRPRKLPVLIRGDSHRLAGTATSLTGKLRELAIRRTLRRCDVALAVGTANSRFYANHGVPQKRISFVPHCVDNERFSRHGTPEAGLKMRQDLKIDDDATVFSFVGKFEYKKRPDLLVRAFRECRQPNARLLLVGNGDLSSELHTLSAGDSRIRIIPFQNQRDIPRVYAATDVLVLPSDSETWGLVVNEAMNCGCSIIVSTHVGCGPDLVRIGETGWTFEAGNQKGLESCLNQALDDSHQLVRYAENSRRLIRNYSYTKATEGLIRAMARLSDL